MPTLSDLRTASRDPALRRSIRALPWDAFPYFWLILATAWAGPWVTAAAVGAGILVSLTGHYLDQVKQARDERVLGSAGVPDQRAISE